MPQLPLALRPPSLLPAAFPREAPGSPAMHARGAYRGNGVTPDLALYDIRRESNSAQVSYIDELRDLV